MSAGRERMRRAIALARDRQWAAARRLVDEGIAESSGDVELMVAAASVRFVARDHHGALECLDRALGGAREGSIVRRAIEDRIRFASLLGWDQEVREALKIAIALQPDEPRWHALATRAYVRAGAIPQAITAARRAVELEPRSARMGIELARLLAEAGRNEEAVRSAEAAERRCPEGSLVHVLAIAYVLRDAGAFAEARDRFEAALELVPAHTEVMLELADLALWRGDTRTALRWAETAAMADATHPGIDRVRGVVAMLEGDHARAITLLDRAIAVDEPDAVALCWRAEAALRCKQWDDAHELLSRANVRAEGFFFVAWILRFVLVAVSERGQRGDDERIDARRTEEFREAVEEIVPGATTVIDRGDPDEVVALLECVLERMKGNRSSLATWVDETGSLRRVLARDGVRHASRRALQLVRTLPPAEVVAALDELVARHPDTPLPVCHRGELHLWLGDLERARADLEAAIELHRFTRWAWIGLTGIDILEGDPERALRTSERGVRTMGNTTGPAVYAYRGEALRLVGELERARADLEQAIALTPTRIAAWVDLALVHVATRQLDELDRIWAHLQRAAPGLLSDASRELGELLWVDAGFVPTVDTKARVLAHGLSMMRGNRSTSCATYFTRCGRLRFVQPYAASAKGTHDEDARTLQSAEALLR